jgi:hypothetical protein
MLPRGSPCHTLKRNALSRVHSCRGGAGVLARLSVLGLVGYVAGCGSAPKPEPISATIVASFGTMTCKKPFFAHIEQLHWIVREVSAVTRKRTRPQWQPPVWVVVMAGPCSKSLRGEATSVAHPSIPISPIRGYPFDPTFQRRSLGVMGLRLRAPAIVAPVDPWDLRLSSLTLRRHVGCNEYAQRA